MFQPMQLLQWPGYYHKPGGARRRRNDAELRKRLLAYTPFKSKTLAFVRRWEDLSRETYSKTYSEAGSCARDRAVE